MTLMKNQEAFQISSNPAVQPVIKEIIRLHDAGQQKEAAELLAEFGNRRTNAHYENLLDKAVAGTLDETSVSGLLQLAIEKVLHEGSLTAADISAKLKSDFAPEQTRATVLRMSRLGLLKSKRVWKVGTHGQLAYELPA